MNKRNKSINEFKRMLSHQEAASYMGVGLTTMRRLGDELGCVKKVGKRILFDRQKLDKYIDEGETK